MLSILTVAFQAAVELHVKAFTVAYRDDLIEICEKLLYDELKGYDKCLSLAKTRQVLVNPPVVSSYRI